MQIRQGDLKDGFARDKQLAEMSLLENGPIGAISFGEAQSQKH